MNRIVERALRKELGEIAFCNMKNIRVMGNAFGPLREDRNDETSC